ncbi:MAG TPA: ferredoxin reductase [Chloroflexota bacterium]
MAGAALLGRLTWQVGEVMETRAENPRTRTLVVDLPHWPGHRAGQHVDIRLTAEDGYQATRSYSIASSPEDQHVAVTVERLDEGEVSPYLVDDVLPGDRLEFRGPIGGYFVWDVSRGGPLFLVAGGSGIVPLMAMIRHRMAQRSEVPVTLLYSVRSLEDVIYGAERDRLASAGITVVNTFTRTAPEGWTGFGRRIDRDLLVKVAPPSNVLPLVYVCGPTPFVETVSGLLVALGHDPGRIYTERFGATGR